MPKISTTTYHRDKFRRVVTRRKKKIAGAIHIPLVLSSFQTTLNSSEKSIVSESFVTSSNSEIDTVNTTEINQRYPSPTQVRQSNENVLY